MPSVIHGQSPTPQDIAIGRRANDSSPRISAGASSEAAEAPDCRPREHLEGRACPVDRSRWQQRRWKRTFLRRTASGGLTYN